MALVIVAQIARGRAIASLVLVGGILIWFVVTSLLAPRFGWAARVRHPTPETLQRNHARAEAIKRMPVIGPLFRFGDALTGHAGRELAQDYEERLREQREHDELDGS